ncbi:hypothetical protein [Rhodococcus jostii]|uniref:hypothetical protein n=1 Tax=Rhodococcus jostii TaxID=132919 RepID=UPI003637C7C1
MVFAAAAASAKVICQYRSFSMIAASLVDDHIAVHAGVIDYRNPGAQDTIADPRRRTRTDAEVVERRAAAHAGPCRYRPRFSRTTACNLNSHEELRDIHDQSNGCRNLIVGSVARYAAASSAIAAVTGSNAGAEHS